MDGGLICRQYITMQTFSFVSNTHVEIFPEETFLRCRHDTTSYLLLIIFEQSLSNFDEMNYVKYDNPLLIDSADKSVLIDG